MARVITCPHCHMTVVPQSSGHCPSCGKDTADLTGANLVLGEVVLAPWHKLPKVCIVCGEPAPHVHRVVRSRAVQAERSVTSIAFAVLLLGWVGAFLARSPGRATTGLSIELPVCDQHRKADALAPLHVNFEQSEMTFIAHSGFRAALRGDAEERGVGQRQENVRP